MKLLIFMLAALLPALAFSQTKVVINGTALLLREGTEVSILQTMPRRFSGMEKASAKTKVHNSQFEFTLNQDGAEMYILTVGKYKKLLYLQPGKATVAIADSLLKDVTVTGNLANDELMVYNEILKNDQKIAAYNISRLDYLRFINKKGIIDSSSHSLKEKADALLPAKTKQELVLCLKWIAGHPKSYLNPYILYQQVGQVPYNEAATAPEDQFIKAYKSMPAEITVNVWAKETKYWIDNLFIGGTAPAFTQADTNGKQVSLATFRGKYVLVDFWASWCKPCRADNPNQVKAMKKFKGKNFTILSVSLDDKKDAWIAAIKHDGLNWIHVSDLYRWKNEVSIKYYVYAVPYNYLVDPNGKVIAKGLHGDELIAALDKLIN